MLSASCANAGVCHETDPGYHWHGQRRGPLEFAIFQYTIAGEGELIFDGKRLPVRAGEAMLLHVPHNHCYLLPRTPGAYWEFFYISMWGAELMRLWRKATASIGPVMPMRKNSPELKLAMQLCLSHLSEAPVSKCKSSALVYTFGMSMLERAGGSVIARGARPPRTPAIARAIQLCEKNLHRPMGVPEMAEAAGFSQYHFSREFQKHEGTSPGRFLLNARLKKAATLLTTTTLPIPEVARACGFTDPNYFTRAFTRNTRMPPGAFRRSGLF